LVNQTLIELFDSNSRPATKKSVPIPGTPAELAWVDIDRVAILCTKDYANVV